MGQIEIRFQEVMALAEHVANEAAAIKSMAEKTLLPDICATKAVWQGESADLLCKKEVKISEQISEEAALLQEISEDLTERAKAMYLAESANNLLAKTRIYI
ncbi:MAG: hypothetical protein IJ409_01200 [Lachnospiraceae bacterium]|nr:hypothetical protein [Lachnospiraceae bacterium]